MPISGSQQKIRKARVRFGACHFILTAMAEGRRATRAREAAEPNIAVGEFVENECRWVGRDGWMDGWQVTSHESLGCVKQRERER